MALEEIIQRIEAARIRRGEHHIVRLVAVSKYSTVEQIDALYRQGQRAFGENKVQDLEAKSAALADAPIEWHFMGTLQKNKINKLLELDPALVHSIDGLQLAQEIDKRLEAREATLEGLLQINAAKEETKSGVMAEEALDVWQAIRESCLRITLRGVMTIGAHTDDEKAVRASFDAAYKVFESVRKDGADICSMGMSGDLELAIECGSNMVRVGSALFQ